MAATLSGDLTLRGPLTGQPLLAGTIRVDRAEITVPDRLPGGPTMLDIAHIKPPPAVLETLRKARVGPYAGAAAGDASPSGITLDLTIDAPARIFVRGRGLDA
jgi:translocation and assembly module TamB